MDKVFIHEYIKGSTVQYCLAFKVHNESKLSLLFDHVNPGLNNIIKVYEFCGPSLFNNTQQSVEKT